MFVSIAAAVRVGITTASMRRANERMLKRIAKALMRRAIESMLKMIEKTLMNRLLDMLLLLRVRWYCFGGFVRSIMRTVVGGKFTELKFNLY